MDNDKTESAELKTPKRGLTSLTLGWIADKMRRSEQIKEAIDKGEYELDSSKVASAISNSE